MQFISLKDTGYYPKNYSKVTVCGQIYEIENRNDQTVLTLKINDSSGIAGINGQSWNHDNKILCYFKNQNISNLKLGYIVEVTGTVSLFEEATNHGQFDMKKYYSIFSIAYTLKECDEKDIKIRDAHVFFYQESIRRLRLVFLNVINKHANIKDRETIKAMALGQKSDMDSEIKELYKRNGISHILAISGLHISLLGTLLLSLLEKLKIPKGLSWIIAIIFVISYGMLTGAGASTIRSVIMFSIYLLSKFFKRTYDILTAMALSMALLLFFNPRFAWHSGFIMSYLAIMGIAFVFPVLKKTIYHIKTRNSNILLLDEEIDDAKKLLKTMLKRTLKKILEMLCMSLSITIAAFPIQLQIYYSFPIFSIFINLIVVPLMSGVLAFGLLGCIVGTFFYNFRFVSILFFPCHLILFVYEKLCELIDSIPGAYVCVGAPGIWKSLIYYIALLLLLYCLQKKNKECESEIDCRKWRKSQNVIFLNSVFLVFGLSIILIFIPIRLKTSITMLDVGQGDCFVIREKSGKTIMVDGGSSSIKNVSKYRIEPYLKHYGVRKIDFVFLSHGDADHVNGVLDLLKNQNSDKIPIGYLMLTELARESDKYDEIKVAAEQSGTKIVYLKNRDGISFDDMSITSYTPYSNEVANQTLANDENDSGQVLIIDCEKTRSIFMGDLSMEGEAKLLQALEETGNMLPVDILKVAHHGSAYSSGENFLKSITPQIGMISAGKNNSYGHPHKETLERLKQNRVNVYTTSEVGETRIEIKDGVKKVFCHCSN